MLKQHQIDKVYGALVYGVHATRASLAQSPLMGYAVLAGISVTVYPAVQPYIEPVAQTIASSEIAQVTQQSVRASLNAVEAGLRSMAPEPEADMVGLGLNREQLRVASYAAKKYRVALPEVQRYVGLAFDTATQYRVDPMLVLAVMAVESSFRPGAESHVGAQGLMQVHVPAHRPKFEPFGGKHMAFDPAANIHVGVQILKDYLRRTSSNEMALKYYVGAANLDNDGGYAYKVLSERERILAAASGRIVPAVPLKAPAWLAAKWQALSKPGAGQSQSDVDQATLRKDRLPDATEAVDSATQREAPAPAASPDTPAGQPLAPERSKEPVKDSAKDITASVETIRLSAATH